MRGLPQPVSQAVVFSRVLPMLMAGLIRPAAVHASRSVIFSTAGGVVGKTVATVSDGLGGGLRQARDGRRQRSAMVRSESGDLCMVIRRAVIRSPCFGERKTCGFGAGTHGDDLKQERY